MATINQSRYDYFCEKFYNLSDEEQVNLANMYFYEYDFDDYIHEFTEDFFDTYLASPLESAQKVFFGNIQNWCDSYIRFNGYGNLESMTTRQAAERAQMVIEEIYKSVDFSDYIDMSEYDEQDDEDTE